MAKRINRDFIDQFHDYGLYIPKRTIYVGSESAGDGEESGTDTMMAERLIKNINILEAMSDDPITILMNNLGGEVYHGLAIYDAIRACKSNVTIVVIGQASSMGSIILQAADERIMSENSVQMIHYGTLGVEGHAKTTYKHAEENKRIDKWMEKMYLQKIQEKQPLYTIARLQRLLDHDTFLTAQQSVELGLADKILGE
jgi:ATP-dependent Clp endopeptidase proteolytic subunit ClpP